MSKLNSEIILDTDFEHNLLVIDDEPSIIKSLRRQFRRDYEVYVANSAEEGLEVMKSHSIQVIISDQRMPGMNGAEFFDQVKHEYPDATRLLLTGYSDIEAVIQAINDGNIYRYITKPWDPAELDSIVREAFKRHDLIVQNKKLTARLKQANRTLEKRVAERTAELKELNKQKDRMMGMVAHDLRGPLGSIRMCYELISDESMDQDTKKDMLEMIDEIAEKLLLLIDDLLDVSAIQTGQIVLSKEEVPLKSFLEKIIRLNRGAAEKKNISLALEYKQPETWLFDSKRIEQVLDNLLSNAFKYSHPDTRVRIVVEPKEQKLYFRVYDQGQGIKKEDMDKLFGEFQKTSTRPTASEVSTGLGLSICKRIVELHEGDIKAESEYGEGSCFSFYLPTV